MDTKFISISFYHSFSNLDSFILIHLSVGGILFFSNFLSVGGILFVSNFLQEGVMGDRCSF